MTEEMIASRMRENGIPFRAELPELLRIYASLLDEWNRKMDLTAVTEESETLDRHFIDSLCVLKTGLLPDSGTLIDVGTGAGFPGMVLALAKPELKVTLLDAQMKRLNFLDEVRKRTDAQVTLVHARAEDGAGKPELRERFDIATARAVAPLNVLCEYLLPYVRPDGMMLCWKGPALREETEAGRRAAHILGGRLEMPVSCPVRNRDWDHLILPVKKTGHTPKCYPRRAGTPKEKPLGL